MFRLKTIVLPVALLAAVSAVLFVPSAFAGGKGATTYDPMYHAAVTSNRINVYSFRLLVARTPLAIGSVPAELRGHGLLVEQHFNPACHRIHRCVTWTRVQFKLTRPIGCLRQEVVGAVYSHLYLRPYGVPRWRELSHYQDVVAADCA